MLLCESCIRVGVWTTFPGLKCPYPTNQLSVILETDWNLNQGSYMTTSRAFLSNSASGYCMNHVSEYVWGDRFPWGKVFPPYKSAYVILKTKITL